MRRARIFVLAGLCWGVPLAAQGAADKRDRFVLGGQVGIRSRAERGETLNGATFVVSLMLPTSVSTPWEFGLAYSQMTAHSPTVANKTDVRESSLELAAQIQWPFYTSGAFSLETLAGPVISLAGGCSNGGPSGVTIGASSCVNTFGDNGTVLVGFDARLVATLRTSRASFVAGTGLTAQTVAAGDAIAGVFSAGLRIPLS